MNFKRAVFSGIIVIIIILFYFEILFSSQFFIQTSYTNSEIYLNSQEVFIDFLYYRPVDKPEYFTGQLRKIIYSKKKFLFLGLKFFHNVKFFECGIGVKSKLFTIYSGSLFNNSEILINHRVELVPLRDLKIMLLFNHTSEDVIGKILTILFNKKILLMDGVSDYTFFRFSLSNGYIPEPLEIFHVGGFPFMKGYPQDFKIGLNYLYILNEFLLSLPATGTFFKLFFEGVNFFPDLLLDGGMGLFVKLTGLQIEVGWALSKRAGRVYFNIRSGVGF